MLAATKQQKYSVYLAMLCNALESYDVVLYGYFAAVTSSLFFPTTDPVLSSIAAMGAFALSFVMRPLGGLFFGHFGDRVGRKKTLLYSVMLMSIPTGVIGFLPTYETIGIFAPLILMASLMLQGLCAGGGYSGAAIFINEHAKNEKQFLASSLLSTSGFLGAIIVTALGAILTIKGMPSWAWRVPFIIGGVSGFLIYTLRHYIEETPVFKATLINTQDKPRLPFLEVLKNRKLNMLCAMGIGGTAFIPFYTVSIFMNMLLTSRVGMAPSVVFLVNLSTMVLWIFFLPIMGHLSDKIGGKRLMLISSTALIVFSVPAFYPLSDELTLIDIIPLQVILSLISTAFVAPSSAFLPKLFQTSERYTGVAFSYFAGVALLGGTTPLIAATLIEMTGSYWSPALYLVFAGILGTVSVKSAKLVS